MFIEKTQNYFHPESFLLLLLSMKFQYLLTLTIIGFMSCSTQYYFPISSKDADPGENQLDTFKNEWYSKHLTALQEPILKDIQKANIEIYRYTNLGTWSNPYSYRVEKDGKNISITKKRTNGQGGYHSGHLVEEETKAITNTERNTLQEKLNETVFWQMPTHEQSFGLDGEEWIVEGYKDKQYHFVTRWTPNYDGTNPYVELCEFFVRIFDKK